MRQNRQRVFGLLAAVVIGISLLAGGCSGIPFFHPGEARYSLPAAVQVLKCYTGESYFDCLDLKNGRVLLTGYQYNEADQSSTSRFMIVDPIKDAVIATSELPGQIQPVCAAASDKIIVEDGIKQCYYLLDDTLAVERTLEVPRFNGAFNSNGTAYYYVENSLLFVMDLSDGTSRYIPLPHDLRFTMLDGCDPQTGYLYGGVQTDGVNIYMVFDPKAGELRYLGKDLDASPFGDTFTGCYYDADMEVAYYRGNFGSDQLQYLLPESGTTSHQYFVQNSPYFISEPTIGEQTDSPDKTILYREKDGKMLGAVPESGEAADINNISYLPAENWLLGWQTAEDHSRIVVIDPEQLNFDTPLATREETLPALVDESLYSVIPASPEIPEIASDLADHRKIADGMEKKYGVSILLANQCAPFTDRLNWSFTTTEEEFSREWLDRSLAVLDKALAAYPAGFFSEFRTAGDMGGIRFLLTGAISPEGYPRVGFEGQKREWYNVVVDITSMEETNTYHHEIWHAMEERLTNGGCTCFNWEEWDEHLNPEGFGYSIDYYLNGADPGHVLYVNGRPEGKDPYFVDLYGASHGTEDRARLYEAVMSPEVYDSGKVLSSPHLAEKFRIMTEAIRTVWDAPDWWSK